MLCIHPPPPTPHPQTSVPGLLFFERDAPEAADIERRFPPRPRARVFMKCTRETMDLSIAFNHRSPASHTHALLESCSYSKTRGAFPGKTLTKFRCFCILSFHLKRFFRLVVVSIFSLYQCLQWLNVFTFSSTMCMNTFTEKSILKQNYTLKAWWCYRFSKSKI